MRSRSPEIRNRRPDRRIVFLRVRVHVARVCDLALGGRVHAVDLGRGERFEGGEGERLAQGVDAGVLEELVAGLVDEGRGGVALEVAGAGDLAGEVVACVEELEEAADGVEVFVYEVDSALLFVVVSWV